FFLFFFFCVFCGVFVLCFWFVGVFFFFFFFCVFFFGFFFFGGVYIFKKNLGAAFGVGVVGWGALGSSAGGGRGGKWLVS
ncbi:hypothetical protein, partial [Stenotrophomonas maltophilia]|uniref:hypothetical protein n=1 Tax=Stenotrophomonas maltophilia TaxID=40324 RepID=UPI0034E1C5A6